MAGPHYVFRAMTADDLPLVRRWLEQPHVMEWWGDTNEQFELVSGDLEVEAMDQFIVVLDDRPFAYIQCYDPWCGRSTAWERTPGEREASTSSSASPTWSTAATDRPSSVPSSSACWPTARRASSPIPTPDNARAIRAYEKAGFEKVHLVDTPDGTALLMVRNA